MNVPSIASTENPGEKTEKILARVLGLLISIVIVLLTTMQGETPAVIQLDSIPAWYPDCTD